MVDCLTSIGPVAYDIFNKFIDLDEQKCIATVNFLTLKGTKHDKPGKKGKSGYFRTKRNFNSLVPKEYKRTENAPRLTAGRNSFHGMNKVLLIEIGKEVKRYIVNSVILELDISACHSRVAASLLPKGNFLEKVLSSPSFKKWTLVQLIKYFETASLIFDFKNERSYI